MMSRSIENIEWEPPLIHSSIKNEADLQDFAKSGNVIDIIDPISEIADDLFELNHPDKMNDAEKRAAFVDDIVSEGPSFGKWVEYPWLHTLVRFPDPQDYYDLRTFRNRNLLTKEQQTTLHLSRIAAFGLSVGSNVVDNTLQSGIGNHYDLFDMDKLSVPNLNRIRATMSQVGLYKTTIAGRKMAELDPYITQRHFTAGYDRDSDDILRANRPDVIIEEVDNVEVKARLRRIAAELKVPLVMAGDVDDRSTLDIERHDLGDVAPFNGKLTQEQVDMLLDEDLVLTEEQQLGMTIAMLGEDNISVALYQSAMLKGVELAGLPQLGTTAALGGAATAVAIRQILLDRDVKSRASFFDAAEFAGSPPSIKLSDMRKSAQKAQK